MEVSTKNAMAGIRGTLVSLFLLLVMAALGAVAIYLFVQDPQSTTSIAPTPQSQMPLASGDTGAFTPASVPIWLFNHVLIIAGLQVLAVLMAARRSQRAELSRTDARAVLFMLEVPMYLGLFGTLLGVCLTQFTTGSLVAPLAYLTTMSGILLHVFGKLSIWLALPDSLLQEEL